MLQRSRTPLLRTILVLSVIALCLLGLTSVAFAVDVDTFEPDNSSAAATGLNIGDPQAHTIHVEGDEDWFVLTASAGQTYVFETTDGNGMDTEMWLYDSSVEEISYSDDEGGGVYSKIFYTAEYSGTYYVRITGFAGSDTGEYVMNMGLAPTGSISGRVTDNAAEGIPDVEVGVYEYSAYDENWDWIEGSYTDMDGYYTVGNLATGTYRLEFYDYSGNYIGETYDNAPDLYSGADVSVTDGVETTGKNAVLGYAGHITGTVTNGSAAPLADVEVIVYRYFSEEEYWDSIGLAYTNTDGTYDIGGLATGTYRLGFSDYSGAYLGEYYNNATDVDSATDIAVTAGATTSGRNASLANAGRITGTVTNSASDPLEGVDVTAFQYSEDDGWDWINSTSTDMDGYYSLGGLGTGTYRVGFEEYSGEYLSEYYNNATDVDSATDVSVTAGSTTSGKNAVLVDASHIVGTVTGVGGAQLPDINVTAYQPDEWGDWEWMGESSTDFDGTYDIGGLRAGSYKVGFEDYNDVYAPEYYNNATSLDAATNVVVTAGGTTTVNAGLTVGGHITGTVTGGGSPLSDIAVTVYQDDPEWGWDWAGETYTDSDGMYDLGGLGTGTYRVGFWDESGVYLEEYYNNAADLESATDIAVTAGSTTSGKNAVLASAGHISGTVTNGSAEPLPNILAIAYQPAEWGWDWVSSSYTEADGTYDIGTLATGTYRIEFFDDEGTYATECYNNAMHLDAAADIAVTAGSTTSGKNAVLGIAGSITANAEDADGNPLDNICVIVWGQSGSSWHEITSGYTEFGMTEFSRLMAGNYKLQFVDNDYNFESVWYSDAASMADADVVSVTAGGAASVTQALSEADPAVTIAGDDRYETAVLASLQTYADDSVDTVVIASGANWPDALGGGALAGALDGPVLLVQPNALPSVVADEIARLGASKAIVVGGTAAVSDLTKNAVDALPGMTTERIGGSDRYETAKKVAERAKTELGDSYNGTVFLSTGANYPDALAASPLAAGNGWPILLTKTAALPEFTKQALTNLDATEVLVIGGTSVVSDAAKGQAEAIVGGPAIRLAGTNRFDTAVRIATYGVENGGLEWNGLALATGRKFPDALAGGCAQGKKGSVMLLTEVTTLPIETSTALEDYKDEISQVWFFGGDAAISDAVRTEVANILQ